MTEKAIFAAGCFWGVEDAFLSLDGVVSTQVGYTGGVLQNPTYEEVCSGNTEHAEAVEIIFDNQKVTYDQLLDVFWSIHDPTTIDKQGFDIGSQYRSAIFYVDDYQKERALKSKEKHLKFFKNEIVTQIVKAKEFYRAEEYHQQYLKKTGKSSCIIKFE